MKCGMMLIGAVLACGVQAAEQIEVRVRQTPAGPQIFVDGKPERPRMVWVRDSVARQATGAEWKPWSSRFQATYDVTSWRMGFKYERKPGLFQVRNVTITGTDGSSFVAWASHDERVGEKEMKKDGECAFSTSKLPRLKKGVVYTFACETRAEGGITWFRPSAEPTGDGRYHWWLEEMPWLDAMQLTCGVQTRMAADAGVKFVTYFAPMGWETPGDWADVDICNDHILAANPNALLIPRISLVPSDKWYDTHPDGSMKMHDGTYSPHRFPSIHNASYRQDLRERLTAYLKHMMEKYPRNFAGVHATGQNTSEWFYFDSWGRMCGYDKPTLDAWRKWLAKRGAPDAAWAVVPPPEERREKQERRRFFDPAKPNEARCVEFVEFQTEAMVDLVNEVNEICRRVTEGKKLVVSFYGYAWEFASAYQGPANTGHFGLMKLLREGAQNLDILSSPLSYAKPDRMWCGWTSMMGAVETAARHGVLWVHEDDSRTHLDPRTSACNSEGGSATQAQTCDLMRRNIVYEAMRGCGSWWMDLFGFGWCADPVTWQAVPETKRFETALMARTKPYSPAVALIGDERSVYWQNCGSKNAAAPLWKMTKTSFARAGTGYGQYLLEDVIEKPIDAKLQVHCASWCLTDDQIAKLATDRAARPDLTRVWCWAPAYIGPKGFDVWRTTALTGFRVKEITTPTLDAEATDEGLKLGFNETWGLATWSPNIAQQTKLVSPKLAVVPEPGDLVLAKWKNDGGAAVVARRNANGTGWSIFYGPTVMPLKVSLGLMRLAGVHSYLEHADEARTSLLADGNFIAMQALDDGERTIVWPDGAKETFAMRKGEVKTLKRK